MRASRRCLRTPAGGGGGGSPPATGLWAQWDASTLGLSDGVSLSTWPDGSGNGRTMTAGSPAPVFKVAIQNGLGVARFSWNGSAATFLTGPNASALTAATIFLVAKIVNDPPADINHSGLWDWSGFASDTHHPYTDGTIYESFGINNRATVGNPTPSLAAWNIYTVRVDGGTLTIEALLNGTSLFSNTGTYSSHFIAAPLMGKSISGYALDGDVGEILLYDSALASTPRQAVETYLRTKWATP